LGANALALKPDQAIADIGAGTGYFARRFARRDFLPYQYFLEFE